MFLQCYLPCHPKYVVLHEGTNYGDEALGYRWQLTTLATWNVCLNIFNGLRPWLKTIEHNIQTGQTFCEADVDEIHFTHHTFPDNIGDSNWTNGWCVNHWLNAVYVYCRILIYRCSFGQMCTDITQLNINILKRDQV